jgi:hypothetical protein
MINLLRNKRKIYVCALDKTSKSYNEPIELYENYQVTNSIVDERTFGLDAYLYLRIKTSPSHKDYYHLGDRVYVDVEPPIEHDPTCATADYQVYKDPILSLNEYEVLLKRRSGR